MIDPATFNAELGRIAHDLTEISVESFAGFSQTRQTPTHSFCIVDLHVPELGFLHIVARDSFDEGLLRQLVIAFSRTRIKHYKQDSLYVFGTCEVANFDCVGLAPPPLCKAYESQSEALAKSGYQLFPMHGLEFLNGFTAEQFWAQQRRKDKWQVCILDWRRRLEIKRTSSTVQKPSAKENGPSA